MADVWTALDEVLTRRVALKVLRREIVDDTVLRERFRREAQLAARLNHRCVVAIYDTITDEQAPGGPVEAVVQELVDGETLKDAVDQRGRLPIADTVRIGIAVADALDAVHRTGIVHRDVKPANILLADDGRVLLTDFGIATHGRQDLTRDDVMMGTAKYLSPEQVEGRPATTAADLYSLGVVLYECLAGRAPFGGDSEAATALARLRADAIPLRAARPAVPHRLAALIAACMARRPADRPLSAAVVRQSLTRLAPTIVDDDSRELPPLRPRFSGQRRRAARAHRQPRDDDATLVPDGDVVDPPSNPTGAAIADPQAAHAEPAAPLDGAVPGPGTTPAAPRASAPPRATDTPDVSAADPRAPAHAAPAAPGADPLPAASASHHRAAAPAPLAGGADLAPGAADGSVADVAPPSGRGVRRRRKGYWRVAHGLLLAAMVAGIVTVIVSVVGNRTAGPPRDLGEAPLDLAPLDPPAGDDPAATASTAPPTTAATAATAGTTPVTVASSVVPTIVSAAEFDPPPGDGKENPALLTRLFDGDARTSWTSLCYDDPTLGEKEGIGILFELSADAAGRRLEVTSSSRNWSASVFVAPARPDRLKAWGPPVASQRDVGEQVTSFSLGSASGKYVLLWFTRLGASDSCRLPYAVRVGEARILPAS